MGVRFFGGMEMRGFAERSHERRIMGAKSHPFTGWHGPPRISKQEVRTARICVCMCGSAFFPPSAPPPAPPLRLLADFLTSPAKRLLAARRLGERVGPGDWHGIDPLSSHEKR